MKPRDITGGQGSPIPEGSEGFPTSPEETVPTGKPSWATGTTYGFPARVINSNSQNIGWIRSRQVNPNVPFPIGEQDRLLGPEAQMRVQSGRRRGGRQPITYYGEGLVDENGNIVRDPYADDGSDVRVEFMSMDATDRSLLLRTAQQMGLYGNSKPSEAALSGTGYFSNDFQAMQGVFNFAVAQGRTWKHVALLFQQGVYGPPIGGAPSGRSYSVVSREDATAAFKEASLRILGRMPTPKEIQLAVRQIQQNERARAMSGSQDPASLGEAAMEQARQVNQPEMAAQAAGNAATRIMQLLGGR